MHIYFSLFPNIYRTTPSSQRWPNSDLLSNQSLPRWIVPALFPIPLPSPFHLPQILDRISYKSSPLPILTCCPFDADLTSVTNPAPNFAGSENIVSMSVSVPPDASSAVPDLQENASSTPLECSYTNDKGKMGNKVTPYKTEQTRTGVPH